MTTKFECRSCKGDAKYPCVLYVHGPSRTPTKCAMDGDNARWEVEEAIETPTNNLQQLKAEIAYLAGSIEFAIEHKSGIDINFIASKLRQLSANK